MRKILLFVLSVTIVIGSVKAQDRNIRFKQYSLKDGLSQATIEDIAQDSDGFMWFATQDGLNRFDGYTFKIFRNTRNDNASIGFNDVISLLEDSKGRFWIGTQEGLNRYDRNTGKIVRYTHEIDGIGDPDNTYFFGLTEDANGNIWCETNGGLLRVSVSSPEDSFVTTLFNHIPADSTSLSSSNVEEIYSDSYGNLWIGTNRGLNLLLSDNLDGQSTFIRFVHDPDNESSLSNGEITSITQGKTGNFWIGTRNGLNRVAFNRSDMTIRSERYYNLPGKISSLSDNRVNSILCDSEGTFWIGTSKGLNRMILNESNQPVFTRYLHNSENPYSISHDIVFNILEDTSGNIWIGTQGGGINMVDKSIMQFSHYYRNSTGLTGLSNNSIWSVYECSDNRILIGATNGDIDIYDPETGRIEYFWKNGSIPGNLDGAIYFSLLETGNRVYLLGTANGLHEVKKDSKNNILNLKRFPVGEDNNNSISHRLTFTLFRDSHNTIWIGTYSGLNKMIRTPSGGPPSFKKYFYEENNPNSLANDMVRVIFESSAGDLWIGAYGGLTRIRLNAFREPDEFTRFVHDPGNPSSISNNIVRSIYEDSDGNLWIGTSDGLNRLDITSGAFTCYREDDGLCNNTVYGILPGDNGNLWLSTNNGLSKFNPAAEEFVNYYETDGLQSSEFNHGAYLKSRDGRLYFGGINGVTAFYPGDVTPNDFVPPVVFTDFRLFNKQVAVNDTTALTKDINSSGSLTLNHTDYVFAFEFSALNFSQPEMNRYAYKLEGFNEEWIETSSRNRMATFTNIPHGDYVLRVKASNDDGIWNEDGAAINLTITPPFWKTLWFRILGSIFIFGSVFGVVYWRIHDLRKQNIVLEGRVERRTISLNQKVEELEHSMQHIKRLEGLLPICCNCKKIKSENKKKDDEKIDWVEIEHYISQHTEANFSHGICPDCYKELYPDIYDKHVGKK